jgi:hypothetical protein
MVVGRITPLVAAVVARRLAVIIPAVDARRLAVFIPADVRAPLLGTWSVSALFSAVLRRTAREAQQARKQGGTADSMDRIHGRSPMARQAEDTPSSVVATALPATRRLRERCASGSGQSSTGPTAITMAIPLAIPSAFPSAFPVATATVAPRSAAHVDNRRRVIVRVRLIDHRRRVAAEDERVDADTDPDVLVGTRANGQCKSGKD